MGRKTTDPDKDSRVAEGGSNQAIWAIFFVLVLTNGGKADVRLAE